MQVSRKIYIIIAVWVGVTLASFYLIFPKFGGMLVALQKNHQDQLIQYDDLGQQIENVFSMQKDLENLQKNPVKPTDLFTSDVQLVNEIQHIEDISSVTGVKLKITISGNADQAKFYQSNSQLYEVPYTIVLTGSFPQVLRFLHYFENSYFISPANAINFVRQDSSTVNATILASFFIHKNPANGGAAAAGAAGSASGSGTSK